MSTSDREVAVDYDTAMKVVEDMGLGYEFRNCSCGQMRCARLRPIVTALTTARTEQAERVWKEAIQVAQKVKVVEGKLSERAAIELALEAAAIRAGAKGGKR